MTRKEEGNTGDCVSGSPAGRPVRSLHLKGHLRTFSKPFPVIQINLVALNPRTDDGAQTALFKLLLDTPKTLII